MINLSKSGRTVRLTVAQAIVRYVSAQYSLADGVRQRFVPAALGIFGHGNVAGLGQALDQYSDDLPFIQGRNEQALVHIATAFAKANRRRRALVVTASIGPGALNMVTGAALATVNRLPVLLLPGDTYASRRQGPVLQQLEAPGSPDLTVNDAFRPVSRFFDRISRPEQLLSSLPAAFRVLANPAETGAVVLSLPQDVQSHAFDYPVEFFEEKDWTIRRPLPDPVDIEAVARLIRGSERPLIIAGGGVHYSDATGALRDLADATGIPVAETFGGKGAVQVDADWQLGGIGLEGTPATNLVAADADLVVHVGTRLTDFTTASQSLFANPLVRFASINLTESDAVKQGATAVVADARLGLAALSATLDGYRVTDEWSSTVATRRRDWLSVRDAALDPDIPVAVDTDRDGPSADALLTQGQLLGLLQEHARAGDTLIAAAGGPPGDILKVWDATEGRTAHLEFGFSCMGYEVPATIGVRLADTEAAHRVTAFVGDGTFLMAPSELLTAAQEGLAVTIVISENHGYQVIRRLQMGKAGRQFGNEFRYRSRGPAVTEAAGAAAPRLDGDYLEVDLVSIATGLGAQALRAVTADEVRNALRDTRDARRPVVIVVPTIPNLNLPASGVWWDVAPAEVSEQEWVAPLRREYEEGLGTQRWHG
jgi:3D-(3,5/4)-trihydroxycyclohexane-1,2-dione acylhydrolase (decyclizing)